MRKIKLLIIVGIMLLEFSLLHANPVNTSVRTKEKFNSDWKFIKNDKPIYRTIEFNDKD